METRSIQDQLFRQVPVERRTSLDLVAVEVFLPERKEWEATHYAIRDAAGKWMYCFGIDPQRPQEAMDRAMSCLEKVAPNHARDD